MYDLGLIGYPIQHSLSPWIHKQFLEKANLNGAYTIIEIDPEDSFDVELQKIKQSNIHGFNVTAPYKQKIIPFLDELNEEAMSMGAVNTVLKKGNKWIGYNSDGIGYVRSLKSNFPNLFSNQMRRILILGAGGAARGIYYSLVQAGFMHIDIANRTVNSAEEITKLQGAETKTATLSLDEAERAIHNYDLIIQTTSVGMRPNEDHTILSLKNLKKDCIVSDIVYQPLMTKFLKQAKDQGASIHHGHLMLLYQAQYSFEIWTSERVAIGQMGDDLKQVLEGA